MWDQKVDRYSDECVLGDALGLVRALTGQPTCGGVESRDLLFAQSHVFAYQPQVPRPGSPDVRCVGCTGLWKFRSSELGNWHSPTIAGHRLTNKFLEVPLRHVTPLP